MAKNYYSILGVLPDATLDEIKSAYRSRVKQYHPDRFGKDSAPFRRIQEAYDILGDPENRSYYDRGLKKAVVRDITMEQRSESIRVKPRRAPIEPIQSALQILNLGTTSPSLPFQTIRPSHDEILDRLWDAFDRPLRMKSDQFQTITMEVRLSMEQAYRGGQVLVHLPIQHPCTLCHGLGEVGPFYCWRCNGSGASRSDLPLRVEFPPGIADGYEIPIPLHQYGVTDICPVIVFRISRESDFEDLF